jgi:O-acetyl-ADP-ribose deacetylase (regulator of RNase III)
MRLSWGRILQTSANAIHDAAWSALECVHALGIESVAFPAFGTGVGGYPPADSARVMVNAVLGFVRGRDDLKLREITSVLFSDELTGVFRETLVSATAI